MYSVKLILHLKIFILTQIVFIDDVLARKHQLIVRDDDRQQIDLSTFGFVRNGYLDVSVTNFHPERKEDEWHMKFGFTLDKSLTNGASPLLSDQSRDCRLNKTSWNAGSTPAVYFVLDFGSKLVTIDRSDGDLKHIRITNERIGSNETMEINTGAVITTNETSTASPVLVNTIPMTVKGQWYSFHFSVRILKTEEEGLYNFIFHNCFRAPEIVKVNFTILLEERNPGSYLSIGQQPLPTLYFVFCFVYVFIGFFWLWIICSSQDGVFKIHYLMLVLMFIKATAMLFHGVNYYFISVEGHQEEAFAVLYYIMYLVKGIFMFVTIVLIGAGWTFVKHVLSDRDKKIFVVIIPLQILANVATIIIEESDEGMLYYVMLKNVFIVIDLVCCGAILFPVIGSIHHLQQASQTDGKAAINLEKLKIFRHFYILVVCYIYLTRIIVLLVQIAVRFRYEWLDELFVELATLAFFILTGHKFRPASKNPYLQLSQSDDEEEDEILTRSGVLEMITKVNTKSPSTAETTDEATSFLKQRENSHEYD
jgi:hypothetical protein